MSCEVCNEVSAKYKCPRCGVRTCCVACVKKHKEEKSCNGLRDKTAFVPIKAFSDNNLLSDYHFLEDVARKTDNAARQSRQHGRRDKSRYLHKLVSQARKRRIDLQILPYNFEKRKSNTTVYWKREEKFMWHIEWVFPGAGAKYTDNRVSEDTILEEALKRYLHPTESDPVIRHKLRDFVRVGTENCAICMRVEGACANTPRYHKLDMKETIGNNLKGKTIIEFPTLEVVLPEQLSQYSFVHQDTDSHSQSGESTNKQQLGESAPEQKLGESAQKKQLEEYVS
ncbi:box C/D snoRNA protein 1-like [Liolophura sinensis]|uniref:box C/D snoRNA protein 1-like n=1 Tax=Liolophura sinensis TaxID=3198878 RepID=UPI0031581136